MRKTAIIVIATLAALTSVSGVAQTTPPHAPGDPNYPDPHDPAGYYAQRQCVNNQWKQKGYYSYADCYWSYYMNYAGG